MISFVLNTLLEASSAFLHAPLMVLVGCVGYLVYRGLTLSNQADHMEYLEAKIAGMKAQLIKCGDHLDAMTLERAELKDELREVTRHKERYRQQLAQAPSYPLIKEQLDLQVKENQALKRSLELTKERLYSLDLQTTDAINDHIWETARDCISYVVTDAIQYLDHVDLALNSEQEQVLTEDLEEIAIESLDDLLSQRFKGEMITNKTAGLSYEQICDLATDIQQEIVTNIKTHLQIFTAPLTDYQLKVIDEDFSESHYDDTMRVLTQGLNKK